MDRSSSSSRRSPWRSSSSRASREKFMKRAILPAIRGRSCPICLEDLHSRTSVVLTACKHAYCQGCIRKWSNLKRKCPLCNADFDSWFSNIDLSSLKFHKQRLPALNIRASTQFRSEEEEEEDPSRRIVRRRTAPLPWRRSFGRPGLVGADVIAARELRWRSSIYERRLEAVPLAPTENLEQNNISGQNNGVKARIVARIEPWIRRELQAILGDPDPSVIVHVASSLYIATIEKTVRFSSGQLDTGDQFLAELRPFLLDKTNMFWHELSYLKLDHGDSLRQLVLLNGLACLHSFRYREF
ncbi:Cdk-activating kinase assembly factor [Trema orientale]|uniref:RING-type E3 ubiquitin transferase n=1 Tax=Trema orientale TaxID=63057 RepID=A0A2P5ERV0_TREOI|nr:Cdk-activating kinase assembly factor [Trema orientale]